MQLLRATTLSLAALAACAHLPPSIDAAAPIPVAADGVHIRHRRVRLAPSHTKGFEGVLRACVTGASAAGLDTTWLCYRESPGRYWLVTFAAHDGTFDEPQGLEGFVGHAAPAALPDLRELELEVEWEWELQQAAAWCTVEAVDIQTHPKARLMVRTVRPGREAAFAAALTARTAFLAEQGYPLPIEGFVTRRGGPAGALQVVFPRDWSSFHDADSFRAFVEAMDGPTRVEYDGRKAALMHTMSRAEFHDADLVAELSRGAVPTAAAQDTSVVAAGEGVHLVLGHRHPSAE